LFLTLMTTGLRPGELAHLLLPGDVDLSAGVLRVSNKAKLGWQVKTRGEREVPLDPRLVEMLARCIGNRVGAVFRQRRCDEGHQPALGNSTLVELELEQERRVAARQVELSRSLSRAERLRLTKAVWRDLSATTEDQIRLEFMRLMREIGMPHLTMPKILRHGFATCLQDGDVDPLIRNQLMGHAPGDGRAGGGLGMTAVYTHSRPETVRRQLQAALACKPWDVISKWMQRSTGSAKVAGAGSSGS
jgi:integrase